MMFYKRQEAKRNKYLSSLSAEMRLLMLFLRTIWTTKRSQRLVSEPNSIESHESFVIDIIALDQNLDNVRKWHSADLELKETHLCLNHKQMLKINLAKQAIF